MFVVREVFTAKPGSASKLAAHFKSLFQEMGMNSRVLTDHIAQFNTVVLETEVSDLAEFEKKVAEYAARADVREKMKGYTDLYVTGRREVYKVM
jgi:hypothetical protein